MILCLVIRRREVMNKFLLLFLSVIISVFSFASDTDKMPVLDRYVTDKTEFLNSSEIKSLEDELRAFENETSNEISIYISNDLYGMEIEEFAFALGDKNGIGKKGVDNGVLIVIKPKTALEKGRVFIATGYGLEGAIPDAIANQIVDYELLPEFKNGRNYLGIKKAVDVLMKLAKGEINVQQYQESKKGKGSGFIFIFILFIIIILLSRIGGARKYAASNNVSLLTALTLMSVSRGSGGSSSYSNFSSGSGSFGGFGGGSFGGGGAGGSW